jgi:membrane associated rhomboid family serine protease
MRQPGSGFREWLGKLPAVSVGLVASWLLVALVVQLGYASHLQRARDELYAVASYAIRDPVVEVSARVLPVVRAVMPSFENEYVLGFLREKKVRGKGPDSQQRFDELVTQAFSTLESHPFRVLGLVPLNLSPHGFATYAFVHPGWLQLLATLALFLLVAPLLEEWWGRPVFAGTLVLLALLGAGVFCLVHAQSDRALLGGSAVVAGLVAAVVVRFRAEEVDFLGWLSPVAGVELIAPAWVIGALWVVYELFLWWGAQGMLPGGVDNAVGYTAHASGAAVGGLLSLAFSRFGWEREDAERSWQVMPSGTSGKSGKQERTERFNLKDVEKALELGDEDGAFAMLEAEVRRSARNREAVSRFWQMAVERGVAEQAAPAMVALVHEELRRGAEEVAAGVWRALAERLPSALLDPPSLVRLAPVIGRLHGGERAVLALEQAIDARNKGLTPTLAARVARLAVELKPELAVEAAQWALTSKKLDDAERAELEVMAAEIAPPDPELPEEKDATSKSNVFFEESDRSAFGDIQDLSAPADSFPDGVVIEATPRMLEDEGLRIEVADQGQSTLAYSRLRAVSVAGVHGLGPKPVVLVDLVVDGVGYEKPLGVIRLRSDRFDPRAVAPDAASPLDALRHMVKELLWRGEAQPLPDAAGAAAKPVRVFESLEAYYEQVLRAAATDLG